MENHPIQGIMADALAKMREIVDSNTIIGKPITPREGVTVIPVSRISFGFVSGGSDFATEKQKDLFGGAASSGASITPVGFLVIQGTNVRLIQLAEGGQTFDRILNLVPEVIDKVEGLVNKDKEGDKSETVYDKAEDIIKAVQESRDAESSEVSQPSETREQAE